ncbi:MAG: MDR family MFS transporter [Acidobacteriota bacterium]
MPRPEALTAEEASREAAEMGVLEMGTRRRAWITFGVMMGMFLGALEATVVVTAMPTVVSSLGGLEIYSWVYSVYFLTATVTQPLWGRLSDLYGRKLFYLAGATLFITGSMLSGLSESMTQLVFFRALQGTGAGALVPLGMTIVGDIYTLQRRARIQGLFSGVWGLSSLVGPLLGGLITDYISWRWVFFLNVPFGLAAGAIIGIGLIEPGKTREHRIDYTGAVLLITCLTCFFFGLDRWRFGEPGLTAHVLLGSAFVLLLAFLIQERNAVEPILPLHLFRDRIFSAAALNGFFSGMALFGAISFIPLFVQGVLGTGATEAGWALTPLTLAWVTFSIVSGRLILIIGYRKTVITGMVLMMTGFFLLSRMTQDIAAWRMFTYMVLIGSGVGLSMVSMLIAVQNRVPRSLLGIATSSTTFFRTVGASIGIAIMGTVMAREMLSRLAALKSAGYGDTIDYLAGHPDTIVNPLARTQIPEPVLNTLQGLLGVVLQDVFFVAFVVSVFAFASSFLVPGGSVEAHARRK